MCCLPALSPGCKIVKIVRVQNLLKNGLKIGAKHVLLFYSSHSPPEDKNGKSSEKEITCEPPC